MCTKAVAEPLVALMSAEPAVVNDVVHRFQVASLAAPEAAEGSEIVPSTATTAECAHTMTIALSVSLSLVAVACLVLMFALGWFCRGARRGDTPIIHAKYPVAKGAAARSSQVAVAVLDLESASVPQPPKTEAIAM